MFLGAALNRFHTLRQRTEDDSVLSPLFVSDDMRKLIAVLGALLAVSSVAIMASPEISGAGSEGAGFPGLGELFDPDNIHYPDFSIADLFGFAKDLATDKTAFASVGSLSGFFGFMGDTATNLTGIGSSNEVNIAGIAMILCLVVIVFCLISAMLGTRKGRQYVQELKEDEED